jgi:hypothetical protein
MYRLRVEQVRLIGSKLDDTASSEQGGDKLVPFPDPDDGLRAGSPFRILALSAGGYHGLFTAPILEEVERRGGGPLRDRFDLISGTSIGGVIALAVAAGVPMSRVVRAPDTGEAGSVPDHLQNADLASQVRNSPQKAAPLFRRNCFTATGSTPMVLR